MTPVSNTRALVLPSTASIVFSRHVYRVAGVAFASILPALFWMMVGSGIARIAGIHVTASAQTAAGVVIAVFIGYVCAPIMLRAD